jgi:hypothetical protein
MSIQETLDSAKSLKPDRADEKEVLLRKCLNLLDNESDSLHFVVEFALSRLCYCTGQLDSAYALPFRCLALAQRIEQPDR